MKTVTITLDNYGNIFDAISVFRFNKTVYRVLDYVKEVFENGANGYYTKYLIVRSCESGTIMPLTYGELRNKQITIIKTK